jgi:NAD+ kinase
MTKKLGTKKRIAVFGGSFNPPHNSHREIAKMLSKRFDEVIITPCGPRPDKRTTNEIDPIHRATMVDLAFRDIPKVRIELFDLENNSFTPTREMENIFRSEGELWHVVGTDLIAGGNTGTAPIQRSWSKGRDVWNRLKFMVTIRADTPLDPDDLPPHAQTIDARSEIRSSDIRKRIFTGKPFEDLVPPAVAEYIRRHNLYRGIHHIGPTDLHRPRPRALIIANKSSAEAVAIKRRLASLETKRDPNLIIVIGGDGTMLHAIQQHWRMRVPFYGINVGHRGFLLNNCKDDISPDNFPEAMIAWQCPLLHVETTHIDRTKTTHLAFNDAWVQAHPGQSAWIEVSVNDVVRIPRLEGDGILVATAAGSTGYARAMGAPPLPVGERLLVLAGSHVTEPAHWKSAVLPFDANVSLKIIEQPSRTKRRPLFGFVDGTPQGETAEMKIRASKIATAEIAFSPQHSFPEKLLAIQFPSHSEGRNAKNR